MATALKINLTTEDTIKNHKSQEPMPQLYKDLATDPNIVIAEGNTSDPTQVFKTHSKNSSNLNTESDSKSDSLLGIEHDQLTCTTETLSPVAYGQNLQPNTKILEKENSASNSSNLNHRSTGDKMMRQNQVDSDFDADLDHETTKMNVVSPSHGSSPKPNNLSSSEVNISIATTNTREQNTNTSNSTNSSSSNPNRRNSKSNSTFSITKLKSHLKSLAILISVFIAGYITHYFINLKNPTTISEPKPIITTKPCEQAAFEDKRNLDCVHTLRKKLYYWHGMNILNGQPLTSWDDGENPGDLRNDQLGGWTHVLVGLGWRFFCCTVEIPTV